MFIKRVLTTLLFIGLITPPSAALPTMIDGVYTSCISLNASEPCNDMNSCTEGDVCIQEECVGTVINCDDDNFCTVDYCDLGECQHDGVVLAGIRCDNLNDCDVNDICSENGLCRGQPACDDGNPCTIDNCTVEGCQHVPDVGAACNDGNICTDPDMCDSEGTCSPGNFVCA